MYSKPRSRTCKGWSASSAATRGASECNVCLASARRSSLRQRGAGRAASPRPCRLGSCGCRNQRDAHGCGSGSNVPVQLQHRNGEVEVLWVHEHVFLQACKRYMAGARKCYDRCQQPKRGAAAVTRGSVQRPPQPRQARACGGGARLSQPCGAEGLEPGAGVGVGQRQAEEVVVVQGPGGGGREGWSAVGGKARKGAQGWRVAQVRLEAPQHICCFGSTA